MGKFLKTLLSTVVSMAFIFTLCIPVNAESPNNAIKPTAAFLIERLSTIPTVSDVAAATEETDPNNKLHKPGSYQEYIYFRDSQITDYYEGDYGTTDGGGVVEVYNTAKEANSRNNYLACFDGQGFMDSGSHEVLGTCVIRTSRHLTATQQATLAAAMKNAILADSTPGKVQNATTVYNGVDYSAEFDPQVYYDNNPDLQVAIGTDGNALIKHYVESGKAEGRTAK